MVAASTSTVAEGEKRGEQEEQKKVQASPGNNQHTPKSTETIQKNRHDAKQSERKEGRQGGEAEELSLFFFF
jgi:hypothetical protein